MAAPRAYSVMYHEVVPDPESDSSGFSGPAATAYTVGKQQFRAHLRAVAEVRADAPIVATQLLHGASPERTPFMITFDDGGVSAHTHAAGELEELSWRGHFFITTDLIGQPSFLSGDQIVELHERGHVIGSHSRTHPTRMAMCSTAELLDEWTSSTELLSGLLGTRVLTASVPGGYYARRVAEAAATAGIEALFTSEPTARCREVDGCLVIGRYVIQQRTSPAVAAGLASGALVPRLAQQMLWQSKKVAKKVGGRRYLNARTALRGR